MHEKDVDAEPEAAVVHDAASVDGADPGGWASGSGDAAGAVGDDDRARGSRVPSCHVLCCRLQLPKSHQVGARARSGRTQVSIVTQKLRLRALLAPAEVVAVEESPNLGGWDFC